MTSGQTIESTVFFGSGPVAARCLDLLRKHTKVEAVITKPRPPHHRGDVPVLDYATTHNLPVYTASNRAELDALLAEAKLRSRYATLIDFGIIVSQAVIDKFPLGIVNSHFSLLPHLRGADPITWSIANGDQETGVSLMLVDIGLDTGPLIASQTLPISPDDTSPSLTDKLITLSDQLLREHLPRYLSGETEPYPQSDGATYSRKLQKSDGLIDWPSTSARQIERQVRAFQPWPGTQTGLGGRLVTITRAKLANLPPAEPGSIKNDKHHLFISAADGWLEILDLKPAGKKEMPIRAFLAGYGNRL